MKHLSEMQKSSEVVHVLPASDARKLVDAGYARSVTIDPAPTGGRTAVSLTTRGRSAGAKTAAVAETPTITPDDQGDQ